MADFTELCTVFEGDRRIASGTLSEVASVVKAATEGCEGEAVLIFDDITGEIVELVVRVILEEVLSRLSGESGEGGSGV